MKVLNKKIAPFWILQIIGWSALHIIYVVLYARGVFSGNISWILLFFTQVTGLIVSTGLRYIFRRINYQDNTIPITALSTFVWILAASFIWFWIDGALSQFVNEHFFSKLKLSSYFNYTWSNFIILFTWSALYFGIKFWQEWSVEKLRAEKADNLAHSAQLQMLRYQLNPHFLFNSLNSIRALVEEDKFRAKSMITELSEFLRYSLVSKNFSNVPLSNELEAMKHYFSIEKTRFEDKLEVSFNIDQNAEDFPVLSFLIHPIIENAIKYGMQTTKLPLKIEIAANMKNDTLVLRICNSGKWVDPTSNDNDRKSTGTGLENVKQRLENAFPDKHSFEIIKNKNSVCVEIQISN
ncbi:MAG: histidine kinase [Bacteroidota bacterium]